MKFGCCANMLSRMADKTGIEIIDDLCEMGYDYVELPLAQIAALSDDDYLRLCRRVENSGITCEACNNFFPESTRLTGPEVDLAEVMAYAIPAMERAARLGAEVIVFGSGPAKKVPAGFPLESARQQLVDLLRRISLPAGEMGLTVVIEPLRHEECNIINTAAEGFSLARAVASRHVGLLVDFFHLMAVKESCEIIKDAADQIFHVHLAKPDGRGFPIPTELAIYQKFFDSLKAIGYQRRISIEAYSKDFRNDAASGLSLMRSIFPGR